MRIHNPTITGSFTISGSNLNIDSSGNITTLGSLTAAEYTVSSSVTALTITTASGSVAFGDTQDDIHRFTGSLEISGSRIDFNDGKNNTSLGFEAGKDITTALRSFLIVDQAGTNITTANDNTAIGYNAMHGNDSTATTGTGRNTAIGSSALASITTGQQNVAIGTSA